MKQATDAAAWSDERGFPDAGPQLAQQPYGWLLPSAFWTPGWNFSSNIAHLPFYFWLVDAARPRLIVDLVPGRPDDYLAYCQAVEQLNYGAECFGVTDIFGKRYSETDAASPRAYHNALFDSISHLHDEPAQIFDALGSRTIDLLHIDGRQTSERSDVEQWLARLSSQGLVIIVHPERSAPSWRKALEKRPSFTLNGKPDIELIAATGTYPQQLSPAFKDAGDSTAALMRSAFEHFGSTLRERASHRDTASFASRVEISLAHQSAATDLLRAEKTELEEKAERQALDSVRYEARIATAEQYVEQFRAEVLRLQEHAIKTQTESERVQRIVNDRDLEVERLQGLINDRDNLVSRSENEITRLNGLVVDLRAANERTTMQREKALSRQAELTTAIAQSESRVKTLHHRVVELENILNDITQSTAWKMTAPFRLFFRRFPKSVRLLKRAIKLVWWTFSLQLFRQIQHSRQRPPQSAALVAPTPPPHILARTPDVQQLGMGFERESARIQHLENRMQQLTSIVELERHRTDYALLGIDGMLKEIELYHLARGKTEYSKVFEQQMPLVSVCVSTMNRSDILIERCLKSLVNQTYRNLQIVVVGDHCTDDTGSRIAQLRDDRISFHNLSSRGPYPPPGMDRWMVAGTNAINAAMSMCEGQFITHLDDDDCATIDRIETLINAAQLHKADFCWHPFWCENSDGTWFLLGDGRFELGQITTGAIFYHHYFKKFPWDVFAYRTREPGDWNRLRKIRSLRPKLHFIDRPLMFHYREGSQRPFTPRNGEMFLE